MMHPALRHPHSRQRFTRAQRWTFELIFLSALITGALFLRIVGLNWECHRCSRLHSQLRIRH